MPETSIVIKAEDRYSDATKKMSATTKTFKKDVDSLEKCLTLLSKNKATLRVDMNDAKKALKDAEKQFMATRSEADGLKLELAQANYDNIVRNLKTVTKAAGDTEKALSKAENRSGSSGGGLLGIVSTIASTGALQMIGSLAQGAINTTSGSMLGDNGRNLISSAMSSAISGAAIGSAIPGIGTAFGAAIGGAVGATSGAIQNLGKKDDAFKSVIQERYDTVTQEQAGSLTTGSALAAQRETNKISFSTLFKDAGIADTYLANLVEMANNTPFLYDDLTTMSKTLATYGYGADSILPVLQTVGDTGAALGMTTSDMNMVSTAIGRMKSSNKTTLEYLNILNDRGVGAVGMLSEAYGVDFLGHQIIFGRKGLDHT